MRVGGHGATGLEGPVKVDKQEQGAGGARDGEVGIVAARQPVGMVVVGCKAEGEHGERKDEAVCVECLCGSMGWFQTVGRSCANAGAAHWVAND